MLQTKQNPKKRVSTILRETPEIAEKVVFSTVGLYIADYITQRDAKKAARKAIGMTDAEKTDIIHSVSQLRPLIDAAIVHQDYEQLKKLVAQETRFINRAGVKTEMPFGEKCESLIYVISRAVIYELNNLRFSNPERYCEYLSGQDTKYWLTTYTSSLNTSLNRAEIGTELLNEAPSVKRASKKIQNLTSSFRGEEGYYSALQDTSFLLEKDVQGNKVRLCINLEWLFGYQLNVLNDSKVIAEMSTDTAVLPLENGVGSRLSTGLSQKDSTIVESKLTEYNSENGGGNLSDLILAAFPPLSEPTNVGKEEKVKGEAETIRLDVERKNVKDFPPRPAPEPQSLGFEFAKDSAKLALIHVFNRKNGDNGRIRFNEQSVCSQLTQQDIKDMAHWMLEIYQDLRNDGESWSELATLVNEAILNTANYLNEHPTRWVYHPKSWLSPYFRGGCLKSYVETYLRDRPEGNEKPLIPQHSPQILWVLEQGANRAALFSYVAKHGEKLVNEAIRFAALRQKRGFVPTNGWVSYIFGILKNLKPERIEAQVVGEHAKLQGKTSPQLQGWTVGKILKIINKLPLSDKQYNRLTPSVVEAIANAAAEKQVDKAQVEAWLEAVYQGKPNKFN